MRGSYHYGKDPLKQKEDFKPHNMYHKERANTYGEHLKLEKKGYEHSPYKAKDCNCWDGYSRVPGTKPCEKGSCKKDSAPTKHGSLEDFQYGRNGHNPDTMSAKHEDFHLKQSGESPNKKRGLWDNIHAKRKRGEKMRKKGDKGAPTEKALEESQSPSKQTNKRTKGKGRHFRSKEEGAGMTAAGVASYKRQNPGSKLKTAVTGDVKPGSKAAKRRKSFCARSKGWTGERGKAARARWKC